MTGQEVTSEMDKEADAIYDVLVQHAGAVDSENMRQQFQAFYARRFEAREFRFCGALGFGGKIWFNKYQAPYVSCYAEDKSTKKEKIVQATNAALIKFCEE